MQLLLTLANMSSMLAVGMAIYTLLQLMLKVPLKNNYGLHIRKSLSSHSKAVTCLVYCASGNLLISASEDGILRLWDAKTHNIVRMFKHAKGPVNNILIVRKELCFNSRPISQASSRRRGSLLPPALEKYSNPTDEDADVKAIFDLHSTCGQSVNPSYLSSHVINNQIKELQHDLLHPTFLSVYLQQQGSSASAEMEMKWLKLDCSSSMQTIQQWKKMYEDLHQFCVNELLDDDQVRISNGNST